MIGQLDQSALDHITDGIQIIDRDWRYIYLNEAAILQSKYSREEILGYTFIQKYPGVEATALFRVMECCMQSRQSEHFENEFQFPDGSTGWFELRIHAVPEGILIVSIDITDRKLRELQLAESNKLLEQQVLERTSKLESRNRSMLASLDYAKGIQKAFLPQREGLTRLFPESFVIHKPKDVVSGDFYWYKNVRNRIALAAADCTGHGIPGALMSMIGIEKLNYAVSQIDDPAEVLNRLNWGIKMAMRNCSKYEHSQDGMDIALCSVDKKRRVIRYAGANRPLWLFRKDKSEVDVFRASRLSIGGRIGKDAVFHNQEIKYKPGDTMYVFSDGYPDSFNGISGKKLTTKRFRDLLADIQDQSMDEQKNYLESFIKDWESGSEQVDDILVLGVRL